MKRHHPNRPQGEDRVYTATQEFCSDCSRKLSIYQVDSRRVQGLDEFFWWKRRDKRCRADCPGERPILYAPRDLRITLPGRIYGFDVTMHIGERHLCEGVALAQITRDLAARGLPVDQRHTGRIFRDFLALTTLARGDDEALSQRLRSQGGIVLMCDGVQFDHRSPVLYLVWDAISGQPLFGERKEFRSEEDLVPLLERVKRMDVDVVGIVTDKERGLVPAVKHVFSGVPYQYCQTHFLKNCALPLKQDLSKLGSSSRRRAEAVRTIQKGLPAPQVTDGTSGSGNDTELSEQELAEEVCELVRVNARVSGKAPLNPTELNRYNRLEKIRTLVDDARKKNSSNNEPTLVG